MILLYKTQKYGNYSYSQIADTTVGHASEHQTV